MHKRAIRGGQAVGDLISINLLEVMAMVMTAYVMVDMRGERPVGRGEAVLLRADKVGGGSILSRAVLGAIVALW